MKEEISFSRNHDVDEDNRKLIVSKLREIADKIETHELPLIHKFNYNRYYHFHDLEIKTSWFLGG